MADEPISPQKIIDDAAEALKKDPVSPIPDSSQNEMVPTPPPAPFMTTATTAEDAASIPEDRAKPPAPSESEPEPLPSPPSPVSTPEEKVPEEPVPPIPTVPEEPIPALKEHVSTDESVPSVPIVPAQDSIPAPPPPPTPDSMIIPAKEKEEQKGTEPPPATPKKPEKKKTGRGVLIAILLFFVFTLPIAFYYVTQSPQFAEIRSRAKIPTFCDPTLVCEYGCIPTSSGGRCRISPTTKPGGATSTKAPTKAATPTSAAGCVGEGKACNWDVKCCNPGTYVCEFNTSTGGTCKKKSGGMCCNTYNTAGSINTCTGASNWACTQNVKVCNWADNGSCPAVVNTPTPAIIGDGKCPKTGELGCSPGHEYYMDWLPNHAICGTCTGTNVCGTWEGESGVLKDKCCPTGCSGAYPWSFGNYCLSTKTSTKTACYNSAADCGVKPCGGEVNTPTKGPTSTITNTPVPPTNTITTTITNTPVPPTSTITTTPQPGRCDASCGNDDDCESMYCATVDGVRRCRNPKCSNKSDCSCTEETPTPTEVYVYNDTPTPTRVRLIAEVPTATPTVPPTPKVPVSGVGPGIVGVLSVVGSIVLLLIGLIL